MLRTFGRIEQRRGDLDAAHAIGERMVKRPQDGGRTVGQPVDQSDLPERPGSVEGLHLRQTSQLEDADERAGPGSGNPAHVKVEVEIGTILPSRRSRRRRLNDPLPEDRKLAADHIEPIAQLIPIRGSVEQDHRDHGRSQPRVALHRPCERIGLTHELSHSCGGLNVDRQNTCLPIHHCANRFQLVRWYVATAGLPPPSQNFHQPAMSPATLLSAKRCARPPPGLTFDK